MSGPAVAPHAGDTSRAVAPFDVCGPLPTGTTVLEASAGTGKTFTIAALATRYVAEGHADLSQLLLVTFSRAATQELRERVRERLVSAAHGLADPARARVQADDDLLRLLATGTDDEVTARRERLARAVGGFDAATIATVHQFAQQMLAGLGLAADTEPDATFVERVDDLVDEVTSDVYLGRYARGEAPVAPPYKTVLHVARAAVGDPQATLAPADAPPGSPAAERYALAETIRAQVAQRKRARRLVDYDDLLDRLRDDLLDDHRGPAARARLAARYRVVMVDEFQDTDPWQWDILRTAFHGVATLVLIGDPKQAIYAFRGADVFAYLYARAAAGDRQTLARNWRADAPLLDGLGRLFGGAALGDDRITVGPVTAQHTERRLTGAGAPLRIRYANRGLKADPDGKPFGVGEARPLVARDVAADIARLMSSPARLAVDGPVHAPRPVRPGDVAVLVRRNADAVMVRDALHALHVPAVISGTRSVFATPMAREWLTLLRALEQPHRAGPVRAAALSVFVGWTADDLVRRGNAGADELGERLRSWRDVLADRGVAALLETAATSTGLTRRLLATEDGERHLTDLHHIGEVLHAAAVATHLGPATLSGWLARRIREANEDVAEERARRLESDAEAVQVLTIHGSKGLQFPVVYVPSGWDRFAGRSAPKTLRFHDEAGARCLDVGGPSGPAQPDHWEQHKTEELGEDLRLLYVAMTRAQCQVVTWWVPSNNTSHSPVHRLLFGEFAPGAQPPPQVGIPDDTAARHRLEQRAATSGGCLEVERMTGTAGQPWQPPVLASAELAVAHLDRGVDETWRRTSYTGIVRAVEHEEPARVSSEPEAAERADEPPRPQLPPLAATPGSSDAPGSPDAALRDVPSPLADLPAGREFGTLVHEVLERTDTTAPDLTAELHSQCEQVTSHRLATTVPATALAAGLLPVMDTPLGPLAGQMRLRDISPADRLAELAFELPLAGGDSPRRVEVLVGQVADLLRAHLPAGDPMRAYADRLADLALSGQRLRGYLTGSIDAVLRLPAAGHAGPGTPADGTPPAGHAPDVRYLIVDYKTNWLAGPGPDGPPQPLTAWHYRPEALAAEMLHAHYPLQALLYSVALHRFLRWRQPGYDPDRHLGGILYLFVRGMCGPGVPTGVFSWRPPAALITDLSALLDGTGPAPANSGDP